MRADAHHISPTGKWGEEQGSSTGLGNRPSFPLSQASRLVRLAMLSFVSHAGFSRRATTRQSSILRPRRTVRLTGFNLVVEVVAGECVVALSKLAKIVVAPSTPSPFARSGDPP
jgi:hypothetical protein